jgi:hypothetical protein
MSTAALGLGVYPLVRDELQKMRSGSGFAQHLRRPSSTSVTSYTSHSSQQAPLSTLEDSGNINNRGLLQTAEQDASTLVHTGGGRSVPRSASNGSLKQSLSASSQANPQQQNDSYDATSDTGDRIVEERRKRSSGDGYTIHRYTLGRLLGKGGFAKVYLCTAMDTGKNYAVKVVPKANLVKARAQQKVGNLLLCVILRNVSTHCLMSHLFSSVASRNQNTPQSQTPSCLSIQALFRRPYQLLYTLGAMSQSKSQ